MLVDMALFLMQQARAAVATQATTMPLMHGEAGGTRPNSLRIYGLM